MYPMLHCRRCDFQFIYLTSHLFWFSFPLLLFAETATKAYNWAIGVVIAAFFTGIFGYLASLPGMNAMAYLLSFANGIYMLWFAAAFAVKGFADRYKQSLTIAMFCFAFLSFLFYADVLKGN